MTTFDGKLKIHSLNAQHWWGEEVLHYQYSTGSELNDSTCRRMCKVNYHFTPSHRMLKHRRHHQRQWHMLTCWLIKIQSIAHQTPKSVQSSILRLVCCLPWARHQFSMLFGVMGNQIKALIEFVSYRFVFNLLTDDDCPWLNYLLMIFFI